MQFGNVTAFEGRLRKTDWEVRSIDIGCDVCGYGTIEDLDKFDPQKPCPECGTIMWVSREGAEGR